MNRTLLVDVSNLCATNIHDLLRITQNIFRTHYYIDLVRIIKEKFNLKDYRLEDGLYYRHYVFKFYTSKQQNVNGKNYVSIVNKRKLKYISAL